MPLIETLIARRQKLLLTAAAGFFLWQGGLLLQDAFPNNNTSQAIGLVMTLAGAFQWIMFSIGLIVFQRKSKGMEAPLNDELIVDNRKKAFTLGYAVLLGFVTFFSLFNLRITTQIDPMILIRILMIVGIVTPILYFVWLERDNG